MSNRMRLVCCVLVALALTASCGRRESKVRDKSHLSVEQATKVSDLMHGALVRDSQGRFLMTAFLHPAFPSATEPHDAIAVFESEDNCATWQQTSTIPSFVTYGVWGYDLVVDERDSLYMTWVSGIYDVDSPQPFKAIMFARSDDGGLSWTEPIYVNDVKMGQRWLPAMAVSGGNVFITWLDSRSPSSAQPGVKTPQTVYFASSGDRGATWSTNAVLETALDRKDSGSGTPAICVGQDGTVYCAYFSMRKVEKRQRKVGGYWLAMSTDRGRSFTIESHNVGPLGPISIAEQDGVLYLAAVYLTGIKSFAPPTTSQEIRLYVSSDGGKHWDDRSVIDDDEALTAKAELKLVPAGDKRLLACWDDQRGGVYIAASIDNGRRWGKNVRVAGRSQTGNTPIDIVVDDISGAFAVLASDLRKGAGDAIFVAKGRFAP